MKNPTKNPEKNKQSEHGEPNKIVTSEQKPVKYVVIRDGYRVSDKEYESSNDPVAINEMAFWKKVAKVHSHGEPVAIVQFDPKRHRVW